ncbi:TlpA family protein disulfide reductase [bacterium]|nr:TlpA family protein disulfide reductase [bacterium]
MQHQTRLKSIIGIALILVAACSSGIRVQRINDAAIAKLPAEKETVVLNFWATWCQPCVEEIPLFIKLQKEYPEISVVGISMDELNQEAQVQSFAQNHEMNYRVTLRDGEDFEKMVNSIDPQWIGALPATFVFKKGSRVYSKTGAITEKELQQAIANQ